MKTQAAPVHRRRWLAGAWTVTNPLICKSAQSVVIVGCLPAVQEFTAGPRPCLFQFPIRAIRAIRGEDLSGAYKTRMFGGIPIDETVQLRPLTAVDLPFVHEMLVEASSALPGEDGLRDVSVARPQLTRYLAGWGRAGDTGFVAGVGGYPLAAGWYRRDDGARDQIPEAAVVVLAEFRRRGIGTAVLRRLLEQAFRDGYRGLALSGAADSSRWRAYQRLGFKRVGAADESTFVKLF